MNTAVSNPTNDNDMVHIIYYRSEADSFKFGIARVYEDADRAESELELLRRYGDGKQFAMASAELVKGD